MSTTIYKVSDRRDVFLKTGGQRMFVALEIDKNDPLLNNKATYESLVWGSGIVPSSWHVHTKNWTPESARAAVQRDHGAHCAVGIDMLHPKRTNPNDKLRSSTEIIPGGACAHVQPLPHFCTISLTKNTINQKSV